MYIATIPNRKSPPAILLREAYRENGKVKNRTRANLSDWDRARIEALRRALRGDFDHAALSEPTLGPVFGLLYTLKQIADALGITAALGNTVFGKLALFLVLARLAHQGSRLSAVRWAQEQAVNEVLGLNSFDEDDLYAALDDLYARQEKIELALYRLYQRRRGEQPDRKSTRLNSSHSQISYAVFCLKKKTTPRRLTRAQQNSSMDGGWIS